VWVFAVLNSWGVLVIEVVYFVADEVCKLLGTFVALEWHIKCTPTP